MLFNCDMGESYGPWTMGADEQLMPLIDLANIACGQHASDPQTMQITIELARQHGVAIGAHPGYPDRVGFGRREFPLQGEALKACLWHQIGALDGQCRAQGLKLHHIKPHGALYNKMMRDAQTLQDIFSMLAAYDAHLPLLVQARSAAENQTLQEQARSHGVTVWFEAFADRGYSDDGQLAPRDTHGALLNEPAAIVHQVQTLQAGEALRSISGSSLRIDANTLCFHGDNPACPEALRQLRAGS